MHGRVKVRTTEEERERKKKEQVLKMRAYRAAMTRIQIKRKNGELDDELLNLTVQILQRNPDVSTLWNIRRECVLAKTAPLQQALKAQAKAAKASKQSVKNEQEKEKEKGDGDKKSPTYSEQLQTVYATELDLTEQCLMVNPKSYNSWHHRCWTLEQNPEANWQLELELCNKYLKYDERNFHTWDYRRYVSAKAAVPAEQELNFCTEKIKVNFSNYSSWHHRSLLLPKLYPNELNERPMSDKQLKQELEMVLTAAFTDPNDSSAWFYQRWLLGGDVQQEESAVIVAFRCWPHKAELALKTPCPGMAKLQIQLISAQHSLELDNWTAMDANKTQWECGRVDMNPNSNYVLELCGERLPLSLHPKDESLYYFVSPDSIFTSCSKELLAELQTQLNSCMDLLDYEPDSKWTLLTSALLMRAIDANKYHEQSLTHLAKLEQVDELRQGYYQDLAQRWKMEIALAKWPEDKHFPLVFEMPTKMARTPYIQYLIVADAVVECD